jgi:exodeoxyribonuclease VII large subunit
MLTERMTRAERTVERLIDRSKSRVGRADAVFASLPSRLKTQTARMRDHLANLSRSADTAVRHQLTRARGDLLSQERILQSLSYKNVLKRGYAVIRDEDDRPVSQAAMLSSGSGISIEFSDGRIGAITTEGGEPPAGAKKRGVKPAEPGTPPKQGSLF